MIEFTMSRVALCICGTILLAVAICAMDGLQNQMESERAGDLVDDIAGMLDAFWDSETDILTLEGNRLMPSSKHILSVESKVVRLMGPDGEHLAVTRCGIDFDLTYFDTVVLEKSVSEDIRDMADRIRERVDFGKIVVEVCGGPRASLYTHAHVERMGTMHA